MFSNFEVNRLNLQNVQVYNILIICVFIVLVVVSKKKKNVISLYDKSQTDQIRGIAIYFILLEHFWLYIYNNIPLIFSSYAVSIFFVLSGFVHGFVYEGKEIDFKLFFRKKLRRIFIPYWISTILFLVLDYKILGRTYSTYDIVMASIGININPFDMACHIDVTRWFITVLLLWYAIFFIARKFFPDKTSYILYIVSFVLIFMKYSGIWSLGNLHNIIAFPVGYSLSVNRKRLLGLFDKFDRIKILEVIAVFALLCVLVISFKITHLTHYLFIEFFIKILKLVILLCCIVSVLAICKLIKYHSKILLIIGNLSYELYLIDFPFIQRYNLIGKNFLLNNPIVSFYLLFAYFVIVALLIKVLERRINKLIERIL